MSTIFVRQSDGDNRDSGASIADALRTIPAALKLAAATPGSDVIHVGAGSYAAQYLTVDRTTVVFEDGAKVSAGKAQHAILIQADHVTVDGVEAVGSIAAAPGSDYVTIRNSDVHDSIRNAISLRGGSGYVVQGNHLHDNGGDQHSSAISVLNPRAIEGFKGAYPIKILGNLIEDTFNTTKTDAMGIIGDKFTSSTPTPYFDPMLIADNTIRGNGGSGVYLYHVDNATIRGNRLEDNAHDDRKVWAVEIGLHDAQDTRIISNVVRPGDDEFAFGSFGEIKSTATFANNDFGPADHIVAPWSGAGQPVPTYSTAAFAIDPHEAFPWWDEHAHILNFG